MTVEELKAQAWDLIRTIERAQMELRQLNATIEKLEAQQDKHEAPPTNRLAPRA